jgi:transketolase
VLQLALPDEHLIAGTNKEIFHHYGLDAEGMAAAIAGAVK